MVGKTHSKTIMVGKTHSKTIIVGKTHSKTIMVGKTHSKTIMVGKTHSKTITCIHAFFNLFSSELTSGTFFRGNLVMKTFLRPFSLFR